MASKYKGKKALDSMTKKEVDEYKRYIIGNSEKFFQGTDDYRYFKELEFYSDFRFKESTVNWLEKNMNVNHKRALAMYHWFLQEDFAKLQNLKFIKGLNYRSKGLGELTEKWGKCVHS